MAILRPFLVIFFANYIDDFHKTEYQTVIFRCLTCLNLYWIKSYDILLDKIFFLCLNMHDLRGTLWSEFLIPQNQISSHIFKLAFVQRLNIPHFEDFGMMHLKYEIRIFPKKLWKSHNDTLFLLRNSVHQSLFTEGTFRDLNLKLLRFLHLYFLQLCNLKFVNDCDVGRWVVLWLYDSRAVRFTGQFIE